MLFHEYLRDIIKINGGKSKAVNKGLARYLGVPQSTVTRWLQGTDFLPHINQISGIIAYFSLAPAEAQKLRDAHVQSQMMDKDKVYPGNEGAVKQAVSSLIQATLQVVPIVDVMQTTVDLSFLSTPSTPVLYEKRLLEVTTDVLIGILQQKREVFTRRPGTILMTRQGRDLGSEFTELQKAWKSAILLLLQAGWTVTHVIRLNTNPSELIDLINDMLDYLKYGDYRPLYFNTYGLVSVPTEMFIIPGIMAQIQMDTNGEGYADGGFLTHEPDQIALHSQHFEILKKQALPLLTVYGDSAEDRLQYMEFVAEAETANGNRYLQKFFGGLSQLTQPMSWLQPESSWRHAVNLPAAQIVNIVTHRQQCYEAFKAHMASRDYHYFDICEMRKIREQALEGKYNSYYDVNNQAFLPISARIEHLEHTIAMLDEFEHFYIALLDDEEVKQLPNETFWEVAGEKYTLIGVQTVNGDFVTISIEEPLIAAAFTQYSADFWRDNITPQHYDKGFVKQFLRKLSDEVQAQRDVGT